jgi:hypothetical protein
VTLPPNTDEQRSAAVLKATASRRARAELMSRLTRGDITLSEVLDASNTDEVIAKTRVSEVLAAMPNIGKATAQAIMTELQMAPTRRLRGLTGRQCHALLQRFGVTA